MKVILALIVLVCIIGAAWLYWFEYRPAEIKRDCFEFAERHTPRDTGLGNGESYNMEAFQKHYDDCLKDSGLVDGEARLNIGDFELTKDIF